MGVNITFPGEFYKSISGTRWLKLKDSMDFDDEKALAIVAMYIP